MHAFVATQQPDSLSTLETLATVGAESRDLAARMRAQGYSTLDEFEEHYTGGDRPMGPLNYVWFQYRFQRLAAEIFQTDGEQSLRRFWSCFHSHDRESADLTTAAALVPMLTSAVSQTLGRAIHNWD
jgi:hypothetical protein